MAKSVLLNEEFQLDTVFPERLAILAKLAMAAHVSDKSTFLDPETNTEHEVIQVKIWSTADRNWVRKPAVAIEHLNMYWECWSAGITKNNKEYYKFRAFNMFINPVDNFGKPVNGLCEVVSGQIFMNKTENNKTTFKMQMFDAATAGEIRLARNLIDSGIPMETIIKHMSANITAADIEPNFGGTENKRTSTVRLGN